jgi:hypothetical protein
MWNKAERGSALLIEKGAEQLPFSNAGLIKISGNPALPNPLQVYGAARVKHPKEFHLAVMLTRGGDQYSLYVVDISAIDEAALHPFDRINALIWKAGECHGRMKIDDDRFKPTRDHITPRTRQIGYHCIRSY